MSFCTVFTVRISQRCCCECISAQIQFQWPFFSLLFIPCFTLPSRFGCAVNTTNSQLCRVDVAMHVIWFISETKIKIKYKRIKKGTPTSQIKNPLKLFKTVKSKPKPPKRTLWATVQQGNEATTTTTNTLNVHFCFHLLWLHLKKVVWIWKRSE